MVELTERERYIITIMHFVTHPALSKVPHKIMGKALHATIQTAYDKSFDGKELQDLVDAVKGERDGLTATVLGKLNKLMPDL